MIPEFGERGYLPPGVHKATLEEVGHRFGSQPELRRCQFESLCWLIDLARNAGIERVVINGSYVTEAYEPNDVDCVLLIGKATQLKSEALQSIVDGLPFLDIQLVTESRFNYLIETMFGTDRRHVPKGMIEVLL